MEKELPKGWVYTSFMDVFDANGGTQPPKSQFISEEKEGYVRLLQIRDFGLKPVPTYIPDSGYLRTCKKDDVLIARYGASIGRIVSGMEGAYNVALAKVDIPFQMNKQFVFWLLKSHIFQNVITNTQRTAQNGFNKNDLADIFLPLPPKAEQERIVAKLDQLFANLERAKEGLSKIPTLLKNFHQAVLTQAVTGKLTEEWRVGKELGEWEEATIKQSADMDIGFAFKSKEFEESGIRLLRGQNIEPGALRWSETMYFPRNKLESYSKLFIREGDIILAMDRPIISTGFKVAIAKKEDLPCVLVQRVARFKETEKVLNPFLYYVISSQKFISHMALTQTGTQIPHISGKQILGFEFLLPPKEEQQEIVRRVEALFTQADAIEARYATLKQKIEQLPQAILAKAFKGELVPQLPTDGDAKELLEEIKRLKVGLSNKKKGK